MKRKDDIIYWFFILFFIITASYFTFEVISFKKSFKDSSKKIVVPDKIEVVLKKVLDGDEISVTTVVSENPQTFVVRILGIKSFDPDVNDLKTSGIASQAVSYLENSLKDSVFRLRFSEFKKDNKDRVLAYIENNNLDTGLELIRAGLSLVFIKFPFDRMKSYLKEETLAKSNKKGLWSNKSLSQRADNLKIVWAERED